MTNGIVKKNDLAFFISRETIQHKAMEFLDRKLNYQEMQQAEDFLEWRLMESIHIVYEMIFNNLGSNIVCQKVK